MTMTLTDLLGNNDNDWMAHPDRPCGKGEPDDWFPGNGGTMELAQFLCKGCPVIQQCGGMAIADRSLEGVWGGMTETVRARIRNGAAA